jgi:class 3 adenylate cyclase/tetratricopeptide (TPR) repeat protein
VTISAHRKVVTVVFCDVVGSTALGESVDPEALQELLARYFERMKGIVESHGGSVEKFIGDAVMAVFGVPVVHEDDALRACRAAVEMRDALPELGVEGRIGVNTGEVLTGTEERLATGDAVNVAARLEQAAEAGEVLIGAETLALVGIGVEVGDERLLELKGKSEPVSAYPLVSVNEAAERSHASGFVGRERELQQLADAWDRALAGPRCELVTVVGDPGVGKSRLVAEALARIDAKVVRGRCLSYGDGITYWPVVEVVKQLAALPSDEEAASAIRSLLGEGDVVSGTDEIAWAFRKLLEEQAPLVVCFDDIQWGEETFLELVESMALLSAGVPLLFLCMARPELLDRRPGWPGALRLEPLPEEEATKLIGGAVTEEIRAQIVRASAGNPLFLTEMVALTGEQGEVEVPATLRALLTARLDQLDGPERRVLERGAVEGELFHRGSVQVLAPEEMQMTPRLAALVRRDLVRPDRPQFPREDAYRFRHLLIRDTAYDALPKATRADLHRRFAEWLAGHGEELVELDELLGYHLEQAARYLAELGRPDAGLALAAGDRLAAAGRRALRRGDFRAAVGLLEHALEATRPVHLDVCLEIDLGWAMQEPARLTEICVVAAERAHDEGDEARELLARTVASMGRTSMGIEGELTELERYARAALPLLEAAEDHAGLMWVWAALGQVALMRCQFEDLVGAAEQGILQARLAGEEPMVSERGFSGQGLVYGPRPASEALASLDRLFPNVQRPQAVLNRALLMAMRGSIDEAWSLALPAAERMREVGYGAENAQLAHLAKIAGDHAQAAQFLETLCESAERRGDLGVLSTYAPLRGRLLCALGRHEEAEVLAEQGRQLGAAEDVMTQAIWRQAQALVLSARGDHESAEKLAREAVTISGQTDNLELQGDGHCDLAEVLEAAGRREDAITAWQDALDRYERKGIVPLARRVHERLAAAQAAKP